MTIPDIWGLAALLTKFALYLGVLTSAGTVLAALVFRLRTYRSLALTFGGLALAATLLAFSLRGANLTGDASGMIDPEMLGLLWSTPVGTSLMLRLCGLALLLVGLFMGRIGLWLSVLGGVLALGSFGVVGHVTARDMAVLDIALAIHLIAVALWIGILTPLKRLASAPSTYAEAAEVGHRFGRVASFTVPALIIAGGYMGYILVGSFSALVETGYGKAIMTKVIMIAILLGLAAANKLRFIPALRRGDIAAAQQLSKSIGIEWVVVVAVLAVTAVLTTNVTLPN